MLICPLCRYENPPGAAACEHCGRHRFPAQDDPDDDKPSVDTVHGTKWKEATSAPRFGAPGAVAVPVTPVDDKPLTDQAPLNEQSALAAPPPSQVRLIVVRGRKLNDEYPLYDGANYLGRSAERPADIDLSGLEPPEQVWSSRQHAVIHKSPDQLSIEDLNSLNGTFVNRQRLYPGKKFHLNVNDVIQIGTVQLRVVI